MIRDAKYRSKLAFRARGHAALVERVGGVFDDIDERLDRRERVRILELGCGYGTVLLEAGHRYGRRVETFGVNREHNDGNADIFLRNGVERGLIPPAGEPPFALPAIAYGDIGDGLPFDDQSFDIVYSQVAWRYFPNKVFVLREVSRVLREDGIAKIDAEEARPNLPQEYQRLVEIWQAGRLVPFGDYARSFGMAFVPCAEGEYLRFTKAPLFGAGLTLVMQIDLASIDPQWDGIKCVYRLGT